MGTQIHAGDNYRRVVELIQAGAIGPVREVHVWVSRAWGLQSEEAAKRNKDIVFVTERPKEADPMPAGPRLGPVARARRRRGRSTTSTCPGPKWYRWWDFGNGTMSDLGSHWNDLPFWALEAAGAADDRGHRPAAAPRDRPGVDAAPTYEYGRARRHAAGDADLVSGREQAEDLDRRAASRSGTDGVLFVGDKGMLLSDYGKHVLLPEKEFAGLQAAASRRSRKSPGHHAEWIHACKTGKPTLANFEYAGWLTEANHLGNVAYRVGKKLEWDADDDEGHERARGRPVHPPRVPQGLGSHPLVLTSAAANRAVRVPSIVACRPGGDRAGSA